MNRLPIALIRLVLLLAVSALAVGCSSQNDRFTALAQMNSSNIKRLANLYVSYQMKHNWIGPADEATFKAFIQGFRPEKLERLGIAPGAIDDLFVSERDGQPFSIRYSVPGSSRGSSAVVVLEAVGVDGKRIVAQLDAIQREVDEAEYNQLLNAG
ncbi:MAG: hypothetical protein AAFV43_11900 [Planctomycetota bacterium]